MTLNGVMAVILCYFSDFAYLPGVLRKSSRSLSHFLMSSCAFKLFTSSDVALRRQEKLTIKITSGYATWFTAGGAIRIAHYDVIDDVY